MAELKNHKQVLCKTKQTNDKTVFESTEAGKTIICIVCKKQYKQESDLMNHMKSHTIVTNAEPDEDEPILECNV